jgi:NADH dehydrogenase FAD-containing subunit
MRLCIIGGGFCGAELAQHFDRRKDVEVTLFDRKSYFEFTPSIHKVIFNAGRHRKIIVPYDRFLKRANIVLSPVTAVTPEHVEADGIRHPYDYLVVCAGIEYPIFLENKENVCTLKHGIEAAQMGAKILAARSICIVGGGLIGTEIAGELATKTHGKRLTIVHPHDRLIERNPPQASAYARKFLERRGAELIFGEKVVRHEPGKFITDKGRTIEADAGIWCAGIMWNPKAFMTGFPASIYSEKGALKVNGSLQLVGFPNVFAGGDINDVPEEKTAQNAERHAKLIARNIERRMQGKPFLAYKPRSGPLVISLGDRTGIMTFPGWTWALTGLIPGLLKWAIEWWILRRYR